MRSRSRTGVMGILRVIRRIAFAELKMVRSLQKRVNDRTRAFDVKRSPGGGELSPARKLELDAVVKKQKQVKNLLRKLARRVGER